MPPLKTCPSCGALADGRFCPACGERFLSEIDFDFKHFLFHHVPHELMHWDGKLGRTLKELVFAPGEMAAQYVRGRRQPYLNPLRLYLVAFVANAFLSGIGTPLLTLAQRVQRYDTTGLVARLAAKQIGAESAEPAHDMHVAADMHWLSEAGTLAIVFLVAGALFGIMYRYRRRYLEHLTLALNVVTFTLLVVIVGDIVTLIIGRGTVSEMAESYRLNAAGYLLPFYWLLAIKRFYGSSWGGAVLYTVAVTTAQVLIANGLNVLIYLLLIAAT